MKAPWRDRTGNSKAMAVLATVGIIAFGLCGANSVFFSNGSDGAISISIGLAGIVLVCLIGMLVVGALAIIQSFTKRDKPTSIFKGQD